MNGDHQQEYIEKKSSGGLGRVYFIPTKDFETIPEYKFNNDIQFKHKDIVEKYNIQPQTFYPLIETNKNNNIKNMKFRIKNEAHSKAIQERLFELGYRWSEPGIQYTEYKFLYTCVYGNSLQLEYSSRVSRFNNHSGTETTLDELYEKKEFKTTLAYNHTGFDVDYYDVTEIKRNFLNIGCNKIDIRSLKKLIKEYEEFKS